MDPTWSLSGLKKNKSPRLMVGFFFMDSIKDKKDKLRHFYLEQRLALETEKLLEKSQIIQEKLMRFPEWQGCKHLGLYSPVRNEVETKFLFMKALEEGMTVYFPKVEQGIRFYETSDPADLQKGAWGLLEPKHGSSKLDERTKLDLVVVPGVVFDRQGYRLGYGKGFYDRAVAEDATFSVGLAFDFQIVQELPREEWDRPVHVVITESRQFSSKS